MTLDDGVTTITLPDAIEWVNEFDFSPVKQDIQHTIVGNLVISENTVSKGMPITLVSGDEVWVDRSVIIALKALVDTVDKTFTLTLADARTFNVKFDRSEKSIDAKPIWRKNVQDADSAYTLTLNLMEV